ncbi:hypothetical protein [Georgenia faecalis]|uniref:hypothetical protein n=1 Tax=Georgenia faecalis TaxID=2483799 RepID=UPI0013DF11D1|nr:hypothetical protein [Georgenia faecalis]
MGSVHSNPYVRFLPARQWRRHDVHLALARRTDAVAATCLLDPSDWQAFSSRRGRDPAKLSVRVLSRAAGPTHLVVLRKCDHFPVEEPGLSDLVTAVDELAQDPRNAQV